MRNKFGLNSAIWCGSLAICNAVGHHSRIWAYRIRFIWSADKNFNPKKLISKYFLILCNLCIKLFIDEPIGFRIIAGKRLIMCFSRWPSRCRGKLLIPFDSPSLTINILFITNCRNLSQSCHFFPGLPIKSKFCLQTLSYNRANLCMWSSKTSIYHRYNNCISRNLAIGLNSRGLTHASSGKF